MQIINWAGAWGFVFMPGLELITVSSYVLSLTYDKQRWGAERDIFQYITLSSLPSPFPITGGWINDTQILLYSPTTATRWQNSTVQQRLRQSALFEDFWGTAAIYIRWGVWHARWHAQDTHSHINSWRSCFTGNPGLAVRLIAHTCDGDHTCSITTCHWEQSTADHTPVTQLSSSSSWYHSTEGLNSLTDPFHTLHNSNTSL